MDSSSSAPDPVDLAAAFVAVNDLLRKTDDPSAALQRLVELAVNSVENSEWAAVSAWPRSSRPYSLAVSGDVAEEVDQLQYRLGEGPCLTAAVDSEMVAIPDLEVDDRWPAFRAAALEGTAVRSVMSFHLADRPHRTALNLYGSRAGGFDVDAVSDAALFAAHARVLLMHVASADRAAQLAQALVTSRLIGTAVGILMSVHKVTAEQAFDQLRATSQRLHRKLHDIADHVTATGELPEER